MDEVLIIKIKKEKGLFSAELNSRSHSRTVNKNGSFDSFIEQIQAFISDERGPFMNVNGFDLCCDSLDENEQVLFGSCLSGFFLVRGPH
jgi:hypothetical protein